MERIIVALVVGASSGALSVWALLRQKEIQQRALRDHQTSRVLRRFTFLKRMIESPQYLANIRIFALMSGLLCLLSFWALIGELTQ